jgi:hypothetical protein
MNCSHGIRYECRCSMCLEEALRRVRTQPQSPQPKAPQLEVSEQERKDFWVNCYKQDLAQPVY